jgi:hypothetical protein
MCEKDIIRYLKRSKDNIIIAFGHNINLVKRSDIKKALETPRYCYTGEDSTRYYQIIGRPLLSEPNMKKILNPDYSIFNISLLMNVLKVFSDFEPMYIHNRSIYDVEAFHKDDYMKVRV